MYAFCLLAASACGLFENGNGCCKNGGVCVDAQGEEVDIESVDFEIVFGYVCNCEHTGFEGAICDQKIHKTTTPEA